MTYRSIYQTAVLALSTLGSAAGHETGDYLVQSDCDAQRKQDRTPAGRKSLVRHAASYAATQAVTRAAFYRTAGVRVPFAAQLAGAVVEGAAHAVSRLFFSIIGAIAEFEHALMSERTIDGLSAARARGRTGGQKPKLGPRQVQLARQMYEELGDDGRRRYTVNQIAAEFGVTRPTIYRHLTKSS